MTSASENLSNVRRQVITRSGLLIDPLNLKKGDLNMRDIAHALAHECRWRGVLGFRSVGWHSVAVACLLFDRGASPEVQMLGLMHDMAEIFIGDIATPIKKHSLPGMEEEEKKIFESMWLALGLPARMLWEEHSGDYWKPVHEADADVGCFEYRKLATSRMLDKWMPSYGRDSGKGDWPNGVAFTEPKPEETVRYFTHRFDLVLGKMIK